MKSRKQTTESVIHDVLKQSVEHPETYLHQFVMGIISKVLDEIRLEETPVFPIENTSFVDYIQEMTARYANNDHQFMGSHMFIASIFDSKTQSIILTNPTDYRDKGKWINIHDAEILIKGLTNYVKSHDQKQIDRTNKLIAERNKELDNKRDLEREERKEQAAKRKARKSDS